MSEFAEEGFLSAGIDRWSQRCRAHYSEWFALCKSVNRYCVGITGKLHFHPDNRQEYLIAGLFFKMLSIFEGVYILTERCMVKETKTLLRALLEALFALGAIANDKTVAEQYYLNHFRQKRRVLLKIKKYSSAQRFYQGLDLDKRIGELNEIIKQKGIKELTTEDLAKKAGLHDFYLTAYPVFSWTIHSNVIDIAQYITGKSDDYIDEVSWHPEIEGIDELLLTAIECVIIALRSVNKLFNLEADSEIEEYSHRYKALYHSFPNKQPNNQT